MKYLSSNEIRKIWFEFFESKKHEIIESAPLIPKDDKTLLWINAGVAPLKKYFDGTLKPLNNRMANVQKCIRTNDIDNVGLTSRHHTFFEMLGNFSIGDYFKEEAIEYGYELLFSEKYFNFPKNKIFITYYKDDIDCYNKWLSLGIDKNHLIPMKDNYWEIGEGPSGPNTEIFFDRGKEFDKRGIELIKDDIENDRYIEIWNIVFSQYNAKEGLDRSQYPELPNKNIDTGAGLERIASIFQNTKTNFETDLFKPIINEIEQISKIKYDGQTAFKVISDHIKTLTFAISDGAMLSNEGRGYVLRRILRRAVKYGRDLNLNEPFLYQLVDSVIKTMSDFYPNIKDNKEVIKKIILNEEEQFLKTINEGEKLFYDTIKNNNFLSGKDAFKLYDTYGFPIELTLEYAKEKNVTVDIEGYKNELLKQKERSRQSREDVSSMASQDEKFLNFKEKSEFIGYTTYKSNSKVIKVFDEGVVLDKTPFYATSGGQVADKGYINNIKVVDVKKLINGQNLHILEDNIFNEGDNVIAKIDLNFRKDVERNHTATHLLHQALKDVLGSHVNQQGSLVNNNILRFDFNHYESLNNKEILNVEKIVKDKIRENLKVNINEMSLDEAKNIGAMALFNEKYDDLVRVVNMSYSIELCGGCHVKETGEIEEFQIIQIESIGSGIYRIIASTNNKINEVINNTYNHLFKELNDINEKLIDLGENKQFVFDFENKSYNDIINNQNKLIDAKKYLHDKIKEKETKKAQEVLKNANDYIPKSYDKKEIIEVENIDKEIIKQLIDILYDKMNLEVLVLINKFDNEFQVLVKTDGNTHAGKLVKTLMAHTNGRGGGRDNFAQGGSKDLTNLNNSLKIIKEEL